MFYYWWLLRIREKIFDGFPLQHAWVCVKLPQNKKSFSLAPSRGTRWRIGDQRDRSSRRNTARNTGGVRLHRAVWCVGEWRLTVEQCWISPSSDATPVPVCSTNQRSTRTTEHEPRRTGLTVSPMFFFYFPLCVTILPEEWWEDMHVSVAMWCHHKLSRADLSESIFMLIWVALLGRHLTTIHLIMDSFKCGIDGREIHESLLGLTAHSGKHWVSHANTYSSLKYHPDTVL